MCWFCWLCLSLLHSRNVDFEERVYTWRASSLWERQEKKLCCSLGQDCLSCYQLLSFGARALCWLPEMYMHSTEKSNFHFGPLWCSALQHWVHVKTRDMNGMLAREILLDLSNIKHLGIRTKIIGFSSSMWANVWMFRSLSECLKEKKRQRYEINSHVGGIDRCCKGGHWYVSEMQRQESFTLTVSSKGEFWRSH